MGKNTSLKQNEMFDMVVRNLQCVNQQSIDQDVRYIKNHLKENELTIEQIKRLEEVAIQTFQFNMTKQYMMLILEIIEDIQQQVELDKQSYASIFHQIYLANNNFHLDCQKQVITLVKLYLGKRLQSGDPLLEIVDFVLELTEMIYSESYSLLDLYEIITFFLDPEELKKNREELNKKIFEEQQDINVFQALVSFLIFSHQDFDEKMNLANNFYNFSQKIQEKNPQSLGFYLILVNLDQNEIHSKFKDFLSKKFEVSFNMEEIEIVVYVMKKNQLIPSNLVMNKFQDQFESLEELSDKLLSLLYKINFFMESKDFYYQFSDFFLQKIDKLFDSFYVGFEDEKVAQYMLNLMNFKYLNLRQSLKKILYRSTSPNFLKQTKEDYVNLLRNLVNLIHYKSMRETADQVIRIQSYAFNLVFIILKIMIGIFPSHPFSTCFEVNYLDMNYLKKFISEYNQKVKKIQKGYKYEERQKLREMFGFLQKGDSLSLNQEFLLNNNEVCSDKIKDSQQIESDHQSTFETLQQYCHYFQFLIKIFNCIVVSEQLLLIFISDIMKLIMENFDNNFKIQDFIEILIIDFLNKDKLKMYWKMMFLGIKKLTLKQACQVVHIFFQIFHNSVHKGDQQYSKSFEEILKSFIKFENKINFQKLLKNKFLTHQFVTSNKKYLRIILENFYQIKQKTNLESEIVKTIWDLINLNQYQINLIQQCKLSLCCRWGQKH